MRAIPGCFSACPSGAGHLARLCFRRLVLLVMLTAAVLGGAAWAQDGGKPGKLGNPGKTKAVSRLMERYRAKLEVKDEAEWKIIQERIERVLRANRDLQTAVLVANHKPGNWSPKPFAKAGAGPGHGSLANPAEAGPDSEVRALKKLVETKGSPQEIKASLARLRAMLREKQDQLTAAQEDLRAVLSARQEAIAVLNGLLR